MWHGISFGKKRTLCGKDDAICFRAVYRIFAKGGANLEYVKKRGGEAVRSCRAAAGGWVQEGDVPPPAQNFYLFEIHLHEL